MTYRVVHGRHTDQQFKEGWYVEKIGPGSINHVVSRLFQTWPEAQAEAVRLSKETMSA